MYRAVTWLALQNALAIGDEIAVTALAEQADIDVLPAGTARDGRQYTVLADGYDITWEIRSPDVGAYVSEVSAYAGVRAAMVAQQRRLAARGRMVVVGRDIGTVVLPDAPLKIYLDASPLERARRRWREEQARGGVRSEAAVLAEVRHRDGIDSTREMSPLRPAADAWIIDSSALNAHEVTALILSAIQ